MFQLSVCLQSLTMSMKSINKRNIYLYSTQTKDRVCKLNGIYFSDYVILIAGPQTQRLFSERIESCLHIMPLCMLV